MKILSILLGLAGFVYSQDAEYVNCPIVPRIPVYPFRDVSALGVAILLNSTDDVETFLNSGCDINYDGVYWEYEETKCANPLFESLNIPCKRTIRFEGYTPLNLATIAGTAETVRRLLRVPGIDVNAASTFPSSPLTDAAGKGNLEMVRLLVDAGADLNQRDGEDQLTVLMKALGAESLPVVEYLISKGADVNAEDDRGYTAVAWAAENRNPEFIKVLAEAGADLNKLQGPNGENALHIAARNGHLEVVQYILGRGVDLEAKDNSKGRTALFNAALGGYTDVVQALLRAGADVNTDVGTGDVELNALIGAIVGDNADAVELLIRNGADVNFQDSKKFTPAYYAAKNGNVKILKILVDAGADVNVQGGPLQWSPLMKAAYDGNVEVVRYLKDVGADLYLEDKDGDTALDLAELRGNSEISSILREK